MTIYTAVINADIDADSPVTTGLMTKLRDNPIAITEGATGAPRIVNAAIDAAAAIATSKLATGGNDIVQNMLGADSVGQSEIKTTFQQINNGAYFTATGGLYVIGNLMQATSTSHCRMEAGVSDTNFVARWRWTTGGGATVTRLYYINSSPPYDLGDGEIPLFVFAVVDNATGRGRKRKAQPNDKLRTRGY